MDELSQLFLQLHLNDLYHWNHEKVKILNAHHSFDSNEELMDFLKEYDFNHYEIHAYFFYKSLLEQNSTLEFILVGKGIEIISLCDDMFYVPCVYEIVFVASDEKITIKRKDNPILAMAYIYKFGIWERDFYNDLSKIEKNTIRHLSKIIIC